MRIDIGPLNERVNVKHLLFTLELGKPSCIRFQSICESALLSEEALI